MNQTVYHRYGKRWLDVLCSFFGLILLLPLFLLVAVAVALTSPGPIFFIQTRVGQFGKAFRILKFRTMSGKPAGRGSLLTAAGDPRITRVGAWLRKTKIDELPQLINVLIGDMSLVGPRPEVPEFTAAYTEAQKKILLAKPGITGPSAYVYEEELLASQPDKENFYLTQVLPAKLEIDLVYCKTIRFFADLRLIFATFTNIFQKLFKPYQPSSARPAQGPAMKKYFDFYSRTNQVIFDGISFSLAFVLAYSIRFEGWPSHSDLRQMYLWLPILVAARILVHFSRGIYRQVWKFISFSDVIQIAQSVALVSSVLVVLRFVFLGTGQFSEWIRIPISIIVLEGLLSLTASMLIRGARRALYAHQKRAVAFDGQQMRPKRVLLYGAGRAGIMLRKELETNCTYKVVGFIDDDPMKVGTIISNTHVLGNGDRLASLVEKHRIEEVIISMATASRQTLARTLAKCRQTSVPAKIIPSLQEVLSGQVQISQLRDTRVEEMLGRASVEVSNFEFGTGSTYREKRVLVTGAGGSIGSELVRQLVRLKPAKIAILDKDENSIYELEQELRLQKSRIPILPQIADVRDNSRLRAVFREFCPEILFHAAAHKHVPLMEMHPCEAVVNNVAGTKNVLDLANECGVERFVFISSDKAVNPANVMGTTKRIGEMLVQASATRNATRVACVRFGNVLGSRGSVIPLFKKQIAEGGPVTVTHPDVVRYFMTIQEAVQLILCAGTQAENGEIFVLDMGRPRNILELAREMISLSGLEPERDIKTTITGLRPGEKLTEEVFAPSEKLLPTRFEKLSLIEPGNCDHRAFLESVSRLVLAARNNDSYRVHEILGSMDLGFQSKEPLAWPVQPPSLQMVHWSPLENPTVAADPV